MSLGRWINPTENFQININNTDISIKDEVKFFNLPVDTDLRFQEHFY